MLLDDSIDIVGNAGIQFERQPIKFSIQYV